MNPIDLKIKGIKCDACDYRDDEAKFEDYKRYLNKSCPKCGANLLTQEDYDTLRFLVGAVDLANSIFPERKETDRAINGKINMDGTGKTDFVIDEPREQKEPKETKAQKA